ncbi:DUF126 domain-containing protein [bacterium]|nr:DUF126 domain-containing protein [bacterium]
MKDLILKGRGITKGIAEGVALVSKQFFGFTHGLDPSSGRIADERHEWLNENVHGKILVFPYGKSSSSGGLFILEAARNGNCPAGVINVETEPVIGAGFIMAGLFYEKDIPVIDHLQQNPIDVIKTGDRIIMDAYKGEVRIVREKGNDLVNICRKI